MTTTFSGAADVASKGTMRQAGAHVRCTARAAGALLLTVSLMVVPTSGFARALPVSSSVSVDYDALDGLDFGDAPVVIPPPTTKPLVLRPPHGVPRYTPPKIRQVSLAALTCPCARHLVLRPVHAKKKHMHAAKSAHVKPAAITIQPPPARTMSRVAETSPPVHTPPPSPPPVQPKPTVTAAIPAANPIEALPPAPPAKVTPAAQAPAPPAPATPAPQPAATQWPNNTASVGKPATPPPTPAAASAAKPVPPPAPVAASNPQVLTPPPLPKPEVKTAAAPPPAPSAPVAPAPSTAAPAKPVDITKPPTEVAAAVPPAVQPTDAKIAVGAPTVVSYAGGGTAVPDAALATVKDISDRLTADPNLRVQLFSYASDPEKNVSRSRRLSLERAVAVRKVLIDNGLDSTRIEVRALGDQNNGGEPDRVDIILSARR